jgi:hypothetical protein
MKKLLLTMAAVVLAFASAARAQDPQDSSPDAQSNSADAQNNSGVDAQAPVTDGQSDAAAATGVGRVSLIRGDVSTQHSGSNDWTAATVNTPVVLGDSIATGAGGRTEVELDYANVLRMDQNTNTTIVDLTRKHIQIQLGSGLADLSVIAGSEAQTELDAPNMAVHPVGDGIFRIEVRSDSDTRVTVVRGQADISTTQGSTRVSTGQMITIRGTDNPQYQTSNAPARDEWDEFNSSRDRHINQAVSWQNTDRYYVGTQDLDPYGRWQDVPEYGKVWVPAAGPEWAPYRDGRWTYEPYYGWTWVSYEPWGWAPYHYGRWFEYGGSWCWWPGPVVGYPGYYPVWAPAYVSFFGFGPHVGVGFGIGFGFGVGFNFGHVGWLATGPGDFYHPWYGGYARSYGVRAIGARVGGGIGPLYPHGVAHPYSNIGLAASNARVRGGMSSMASNEFGHGAVPAHQSAIDAKTFREGGMVSGRMPVQPTKASYQSVNRPVNASSVPSHSMAQQHFFNSAANRNGSSAAGGNANRGFTAPTATHSVANGNSNFANHAGTQGNWHTFTPPATRSTAGNAGGGSAGGRGYSASSNSGNSRPSLNMSHPIVAPRSSSSSGYGGGNSPNRAPANTYRPPANTYRPPSSASRPSPAYRAPSNSGGHSNRGNGGKSGSGGGRSSGGSGHSGGHPHR